MTEKIENQESQKDDLQSVVEKTADKRAEFTRRFLEKNDKSIADFVEELKKKPFEITIDPKDDKSLALGVFNLQKKLGFSEEDNSQGCDGKFGPYTKRAYEGHGVEKKGAGDRAALADDVALSPAAPAGPVAEKAPQPKDAKEGKVENTSEFEPVKTSETVFVGDSLTYLMKSSLKDASRVYKGAMQTGWMRENFSKFLAEKKAGMHPNVKRVSILGGFNDLTSLKSFSSIKTNLSAMYEAARKAGLTVVACTIPEWDYEAGRKAFQRTFEKHGWSRGNYPLSAEELEGKTKELNDWIKSQAGPGIRVVDLFAEMHDRKKYPRGDFVHLYGKGAERMAALIKERGGIRDS